MVENVVQAINYIVKTPGNLGGRARIAGRRIGVRDIVLWHIHLDASLTEIAKDYNLSLAEIYAALAYYYDHVDEIESSIAENEAVIQRMPFTPVTQEELAKLDEMRQRLGRLEIEMTAPEIAREFAISEHTVREAARKGWIPARRAGKVWLIKRGDAFKRWGKEQGIR
jgi:uncharacterized protein (DUF433 family)